MGVVIGNAITKLAPVAADKFSMWDSVTGLLRGISWANILTTILGTINSWTKAQIGTPVALTVVTNAVAVDLSLANNFSLALQATTSQVLSTPTNAVAGQAGQIAISQNAVPSALTYGANWIPVDGVTPAVSTTPGAQNLLTYYVVDPTHIWFYLNKNGVA
jgi:hypothetical protein